MKPSDTGSGTEFDAVLDRHGRASHRLVQILRELQQQRHWLSRDTLSAVATGLGLSVAHVEGVAGSYRFFHLQPVGQYRVLFSDNVTDHMLGSQEMLRHLRHLLKVEVNTVRHDGRVSISTTSCTGMCDQGPALLVNHHHVVTRLTLGRIEHLAALIEQQVPVAQWPSEWFRIDDQIQRADVKLGDKSTPGQGIAAALARGPQGMLDDIKRSKLRGRGGAGYATGTKWQLCRNARSDTRYVVCNADEGEPGTFKDRVLLSSYADAVFEGMTIAALVVGARQGLMYLRGEYRYLLEALQATLERRRRAGLLGVNIQGCQGFDFDIEINVGAGAYVCGEESALIESLEGKRGTPRIRPPFPVESGYMDCPTIVNNVETFCDVNQIAMNSGAWWAAIGTPQSTGTKIHSVSGDCERPGLYEYPLGTRIGRILEDCGARNPQAVQVGGPSGVCLSALEFGRRIAFEDVPTAGAFMVFDRTRDMFDVAHNFAHFFAHESCGFCTPCRVGTELVLRRMDKLKRGFGSSEDVQVLYELDKLMHGATHCGLGAAACNPLRDTIAKFRPAYEQHLNSLHFAPGFDMDAELSQARLATGRDDSGAHLETLA
jgi:[NiFe] hydrogenase diaphorase moiety large subunit